MVSRQPGRPSEREFIGAARRFIADDYVEQPVHVMSGPYANVFMVKGGLSYDTDVIRREQLAEGFAGEPESLEQFAYWQLARYQKLRANERMQ